MGGTTFAGPPPGGVGCRCWLAQQCCVAASTLRQVVQPGAWGRVEHEPPALLPTVASFCATTATLQPHAASAKRAF